MGLRAAVLLLLVEVVVLLGAIPAVTVGVITATVQPEPLLIVLVLS